MGSGDGTMDVLSYAVTRSTTRRLAAMTVLVAVLATERSASAEPPAVVLDQRLVTGVDGTRGLSLGIVAAGARWSATPTLDLQLTALTLRTAGTIASGEPARIGNGGEAALRVAPWPAERTVRPYLGAGLGLLLFPRTPFLPGGDVYEGLVTFSVGAELRLSEHLSAGAQAFSAHLSNGQGLGPHNPAYDGFGAAVEVAWSASRDSAPTSPAKDGRAGRTSNAPGISLDTEVGRAADATFVAGRGRLVQRTSRHALVLVDAAGGSLDAFAFGEVGVALVAHLGLVSVGAQGGYRGFADAQIGIVTAQAEGHITNELSLVAMGHHEASAAFGSLSRAAVGGRAFPLPDLAIDLGVGFDRIADDSVYGRDTSDPYVGIEWRLPLRPAGLATSLFLERQVSTLDIIGIRIGYDMGHDLRAFARHDAWRRLR